MRYILDTSSVYGNITPKTINKAVFDINTKEVIGKITEINRLSKNKLELKYTLYNKDNKNDRTWNKIVCHKFIDNRLYCQITEKRNVKIKKYFLINVDLVTAFDATCEFFNTKPAVMISELMEKFINDSEPIIKNYLINNGGNNNGK